MQVDYIIIGQGICGTFLSHYLLQENQSVIVFDKENKQSASRVAAGVINPITGRRLVKTWLIDELIPFSQKAYTELSSLTHTPCIAQKNVIDFFPNPFMKENFLKRIEEKEGFLSIPKNISSFSKYFNYEFGAGEIAPSYSVSLEAILPAWRNYLKEKNALMEDSFDSNALSVKEEAVFYQNLKARKIIFCDGVAGADNHFFNLLPFAPNKGEALIVEIPGLPTENIFKKGLTLVPLLEKDIFWIGSNYLWSYENEFPSENFRKTTEDVLHKWLKNPFKIIDHRVGLRPATLERRPFVGLHPKHNNVGILNGMGTKGCSLAPYFAKQLCEHLINGKEISAEANISRYHNILSKN